MKHKPVLFNKIEEHRGKGREVIGLIGTHHGVGVTYTSLMLAFYMGEELGKKTALIECNRHQDMKRIHDAYEWVQEETGSFSFHKVTCHKEVTPSNISVIFGEAYECIILDFGIDIIANKEEFLRCGTKIVVGGRSEWDQQKLTEFSIASSIIRGSDSWLYFISQANNKIISKVKKEMDRKVWAVPISLEPTVPTKHSNHFFSQVFH